MREVVIQTEEIKLAQFLKLADIVGSGSEAKFVILEGEVSVNREVETRRGRKLRNGDIVTFENSNYLVRAGISGS